MRLACLLLRSYDRTVRIGEISEGTVLSLAGFYQMGGVSGCRYRMDEREKRERGESDGHSRNNCALDGGELRSAVWVGRLLGSK